MKSEIGGIKLYNHKLELKINFYKIGWVKGRELYLNNNKIRGGKKNPSLTKLN